MCVLQTRSPPVCSWKSSERVGSVQLDWFAGAHFSAAALAGCLQCSEFSEPVWAAPAGGSGNWSLRFPRRVWFHFSLLSNNCLSVRITSSPADDECPADQIFSVSLLDLQVCLCYTDVFALTFHQFLPRTTLIIQRINCVALFFPTHSGIKRSAKLLGSTSELSAASDVIFPAILNTQITWSWLLTQEESGCLLKNVSLRLGRRRLSVEESGWLQKKVKSKPEPPTQRYRTSAEVEKAWKATSDSTRKLFVWNLQRC